MSFSAASVVKAYLPMDWGQLHYRTVPADPSLPLLIMLHQSPLSSRNYESVLPLLADHCRPLALDTPGYGGSSAVPEHWTVADYAQVVWDVADKLGAQRVFVFGRATGAVFALEAALAQPQRVQGLVLHGMPVYTDAERADRMRSFAPPFPPAADGAHLTGIWKRIHSEYPWIDPELATHFTHDFLSAGPDFARSYRAIWRYDLPQRLAAGPKLPTLLLGGSADRIAFMHARAVALLPQAQAVWLEGATDFLAEQEPARFAKQLTDFMAAHPADGGLTPAAGARTL
jgi:pimeloyl-ACP methyl ester carboxylesterase